MYLQHLSVSGFRGIGDSLDLPLSHRTILYGPNGSGKSSILQSIAWALYANFPTISGGVFTKEDALVNDFLDVAKTEVKITFSTGEIISRRRNKQSSTSRGSNPLSVSFPTNEPQSAIEKLIGLNAEEFFASVFLHQETIRDFLTTSPEKRSATIDRMIGTYLLRALIKSVDPKLPDKTISEEKANIEAIEARLSSATVISREVIDKKKTEYGDPAFLPGILEEIQNELLPLLTQLELPIPESTLDGLSTILDEARRKQMELVRNYTTQEGEISKLKQSYEQASDNNWEAVRQQRIQYGDPACLTGLLQNIRERFTPLHKQLGLPEAGCTLDELEKDLIAARRAQNVLVGRVTQESANLINLKDHYQQAAVTNWQELENRKAQWGDIQTLPILLKEIQESQSPILSRLGISLPQLTLSALDDGLSAARRIQPGEVGRLERLASDYLDLKARYMQAVQDVIESPIVPPKLLTNQSNLDSKVKELNSNILDLNKQVGERNTLNDEVNRLQDEIKELQDLKVQIEQDQVELDRLELVSQQVMLYNQVLDVGRRYLEQSRPEQCPLCKRSIEELDNVIDLLHGEIPADVEKLQNEIQQRNLQIGMERNRLSALEGKQVQFDRKKEELAGFPINLEQQIEQIQKNRSQVAEDLARINVEVDQMKARISIAEESRKRVDDILSEIEQSLGQESITDVQNALEQAAQAARQQATEIRNIDFQPIEKQLDHAKQLDDMAREEERLQKQLKRVLEELVQVLGPIDTSLILELLDNTIRHRQQQVAEIQAIDFQPLATDLNRASQLQRTLDEEARLQKHLDQVQAEVRRKLNLPEEEENLQISLDRAIQETHNQAQKINNLDLQPIEDKLQRVRQISEIARDEEKLKDLEHSYQTAQREKSRCNYHISNLIELRNALNDIYQTTKRHQESIVSEVLKNLDIGRYYQQLDPHPAYTELQIEPEPSASGTYKYWIRARTANFDHSAYVQARFSTAQANCAAIAIFLAVNQHLSKNLETVLLDDPSQSMDPDHKQRLAQTLATHPRQVIVATEDPQMYGLLKDALTSPVIYELKPWTTLGSMLVDN